jgi:hypothetical protein
MMELERSKAASPRTDKELCEALNRHPILRERMMNLLALVDSAEIERADDAERWAIRELRGLGQEVLKDWAVGQARRASSEMNADEVNKDGKKRSGGIARTAKSKWKNNVSERRERAR